MSNRASNPSLFGSYEKLVSKIEKNPFDRRLFQPSLVLFEPLDESYFSELRAAEEYKEFVDSLNQDPKLMQLNHKAKWSASLPPFGITQRDLTQRLLSEYLIRRRHSATYGDAFAEDLYLQWERELYEDELHCCGVGFLEYASTGKLIDLGAGTTIRLLSLPEKSEWEERCRVWMQEEFSWFVVETKWTERAKIESKPTLEAFKPKVPSAIRHLGDALRLFGASNSHLSLIFVSTESKTLGILHELARRPRLPKGEDFFTFDDARSDKFKTFWSCAHVPLENLNESWWINALSRYELSTIDRAPADKLIDIVIAIEAALQTADQELRRSLSQRCAVLDSITCTNAEAPSSKTFDLVYNAYWLRNKLVHGSVEESHIEKVKSQIEPLTEFVRRALLKVLALCQVKKKEEVIKLLDRGVFGQQDREELHSLLKESFIHECPDVLNSEWWRS